MLTLLKDSALVSEIEKLINEADDYLIFVSPYIKLHERIKSLIKTRTQQKPWIEIVIVFGKNENQAERSLAKSDLAFFKELPCVKICYERRLHAKFYGSEDGCIITSMNLHQFSHDNNIEVGIRYNARKISLTDIESEIQSYFQDIIENAQLVYAKEARMKSKAFGLMEEYSHSEIICDNTQSFYEEKKINSSNTSSFKFRQFSKKVEANGFCIRTGRPIPYNPAKPMSAEAYESWAKFKNPDYPEKYCHKSGKLSNGKTSMRAPVLQ